MSIRVRSSVDLASEPRSAPRSVHGPPAPSGPVDRYQPLRPERSTMMADPAPPQAQLSTRDALLTQLLSAKPDGLTLQQLGERLGITRTAIRQHVTALQKDGLVMPTGVMPTGRRPSRTYGLTDRGKETFQRRYDLLSVSMLRAMRAQLGEEAAEAVLMAMADALAADWLAELAHLGSEERRLAVVTKMQQLGYHARL